MFTLYFMDHQALSNTNIYQFLNVYQVFDISILPTNNQIPELLNISIIFFFFFSFPASVVDFNFSSLNPSRHFIITFL